MSACRSSLLSDVHDVLMRFTGYHQVALVADIEKAFLMVQVSKADRDVLRLLWINDPTGPLAKILKIVVKRVVFGVTRETSCSKRAFKMRDLQH